MKDELKRLRQEQAKRVMPMIGGLLDAWDELPNDVSTDPDLENLFACLEGIREAMEGPQ